MARLAGENSCSSGAVNGGYGRGCEQQHQEDGWTTLTSEKRWSAQTKLRNRRRNLFTLRRDGERTNEVDFRLQREKFHGEELTGNDGLGGEIGMSGKWRPDRPAGTKRRRRKTRTSQGPGNQKWIWFLWAFMLMRMEPAGATTAGNNCGRESTDICFLYHPYIQRGVPQGSSVVLAELPGPKFQVKMVIFSEENQELNCDQYSADYDAGCRMELFGEDLKNLCGSLYPSILLQSNGNRSQELIATNVTGRMQYCMKISSQNHYWIHQGGIFIQPAPTCPALSMPTFVMKSGCNEDPSGQVKPGTTCHFSCPDGYIGRGDVNRTCLADGTWSNASFTCEAVTCPGDNVTKPYLEGCDPDSAGGIATGTICSFPCDGCIDDVRMVCLHNGTWLDISTNSPDIPDDGYKVGFIIVMILFIFLALAVCLIFLCWKKKKNQHVHERPQVRYQPQHNGTGDRHMATGTGKGEDPSTSVQIGN